MAGEVGDADHLVMTTQPALSGQVVEVSNGEVHFVELNGATFAKATATVSSMIPCSNGNLVIIDRVLSFPVNTTSELLQASGLTSLTSAVGTAGLVQAANTATELTVFAPTNAAFQSAPPCLTYARSAALFLTIGRHFVQRRCAHNNPGASFGFA